MPGREHQTTAEQHIRFAFPWKVLDIATYVHPDESSAFPSRPRLGNIIVSKAGRFHRFSQLDSREVLPKNQPAAGAY
jgi:hypothetical protein